MAEASPAKSVICRECQEECIIDAHRELRGKGAIFYGACHKRSDISRISISPEELERWKITKDMVVRFVASQFDCNFNNGQSEMSDHILIGHIQTKSGTEDITLFWNETPDIEISGRRYPLCDQFSWDGQILSIAVPAILEGRAPSSHRRRKSGAKQRYNWRGAKTEFMRLWKNNTDGISQAEYIRMILEWFADSDKHPSESRVKDYVRDWMNELQGLD